MEAQSRLRPTPASPKSTSWREYADCCARGGPETHAEGACESPCHPAFGSVRPLAASTVSWIEGRLTSDFLPSTAVEEPRWHKDSCRGSSRLFSFNILQLECLHGDCYLLRHSAASWYVSGDHTGFRGPRLRGQMCGGVLVCLVLGSS